MCENVLSADDQIEGWSPGPDGFYRQDSPVGEGPENVLVRDGKYLNFKAEGTGFIVTPARYGQTTVTGIALSSANDFPNRDPLSFELYGSNGGMFEYIHSAKIPYFRCGGVVWCGVVRCGAVRCGVVRCGAVRCGVVWCGAVRCGVVWCGAVRCGAVRCGAVRCCGCGAVRCCGCGAVRCGVVWCGVVRCGAVWCGVVWRRRRRRRSACRGPTYGEPWRRPPGAPRRHSRGSPPSYLR